MIKSLMMETGKMISFMVMELSTINRLHYWKNLSIIKIGPWSNNTGSNTKVNFLWITSKAEESCIFQTDKSLRDGSRRI